MDDMKEVVYYVTNNSHVRKIKNHPEAKSRF